MATDLYVMYAVYALYMACGFICCIASPAGRNVRWKSVVITYAAPAGRASNKFKENMENLKILINNQQDQKQQDCRL